jgi:hypothetical protein
VPSKQNGDGSCRCGKELLGNLRSEISRVTWEGRQRSSASSHMGDGSIWVDSACSARLGRKQRIVRVTRVTGIWTRVDIVVIKIIVEEVSEDVE